MSVEVETVVIGAGAVGLAIAAERAGLGHDVLVVERHHAFGTETSSRNSEVIHAGLYYPEGSLRAKLCVEGKKRLYAFAEEHKVPFNRCGKLLVATNEAEVGQLAMLEAKAIRNGVGDLTRLTVAEANRLEPEIRCVAATLSPSTGIIDSHSLMAAFETRLLDAGGQVAFNSEVVGIAPVSKGEFRLSVLSEGEVFDLTCARVVNAAGLGASHIGHMLPRAKSEYVVPKLYPAKGHYFALSARAPFKHLVYPMPSPDALGIHLTLDMSGAAKFGPDIHWQDDLDYAFVDADARRAMFAREIKRYWPGLPEGALVPAYTGIRPKIYAEGTPPADFAIHGENEHGVPGFVGLYGIESPGLTASLAIADCVARLLD
ncbi:NAD(P)/FAD-dependent oxidoreductase [Hyphomicrobium sp.]|uniref:NAD(P)/FAD-dependent oxidoreductase n=1 Tax=Hyphomicrobium sp. TaxID=82 RepID=UPI000FBC03E1|nr:NAD(P)/FAD-dependent oxidoreductase [Hyphomicrobium sp.]RUP10138.1 MAG: NAD(P)/FAD-dependent oxidoreductase [Hyphomicrobium sp.]